MNETQAIFLLHGALLAWGLFRRPQRIMLALAGTWLAAIAVGAWWPAESALPIVMALDAALIVAMGWLYRTYHSDRALIVLWLSALKIVWAMAAVLLAWPQHFRAAGINGAFVVQVLIGGGFADGVMAWLGHSVRHLRNRLRRGVAGV